ncbi:MAG: NAD-dependent epimerase/dehydratase family protein [Steroidobacterales bacterium]
MAVIAVSGASGFIGMHLCPDLIARGHQVIAVSRAQLMATDLAASLAGAGVFIHLAGRAHVLRDMAANPEAAFRVANLQLTQTVATAAARAQVQRLVFLSSAGVLGRSSPKGGFTDHSPPAPHDAYTRTKLEAEHWLRSEAQPRMEIVILRPPLVYGWGARGNFARLFRAVQAGWPLPIGALDAPRSMLGIRNLIDLVHVAAVDPRAAGHTMLAADAETTTVAAFARELGAQMGCPPRLMQVPKWLVTLLLRASGRTADVGRLTEPFELCPTVARAALGWSPPFSLAQELAQVVSRDASEQHRS